MSNEKIYCNCMEEIKARLTLLMNFFNGKGGTGSEVTDIEHGCLQIRKILELIALASIAPNKAQYAAVRENFHSDWKADKILNVLRKINPDFYPTPFRQTRSTQPGVKWHLAEETDPFLTDTEYLSVFDECADLLHAANPFGATKDFRAVRPKFQKWINAIMTLLRLHRVRLIDGSVWIVQMEHPQDKKVHAFIAQPNES